MTRKLVVGAVPLVAVAALEVGLTGPIRAVVGLLALLVAPGAALALALPRRDALLTALVVVAGSLATVATTSTLLLQLDRWTPELALLVVAAVTVAYLFIPMQPRRAAAR